MLFVFGVLTYHTIRRAYYEVFYYAHFFSGVVFLVVLWHATMSWYYILPGLALYALDHGLRLMRNLAAGVVLADVSVVLKDTSEPHEDLRVHPITEVCGYPDFTHARTLMSYYCYCLTLLAYVTHHRYPPPIRGLCFGLLLFC